MFLAELAAETGKRGRINKAADKKKKWDIYTVPTKLQPNGHEGKNHWARMPNRAKSICLPELRV